MLGYLCAGLAIQDYLDPTFLKAAEELKYMALLVVLMRAGLAIRLAEMNANKVVVLLFSTVPYLSEFLVWLYAGNMYFT